MEMEIANSRSHVNLTEISMQKYQTCNHIKKHYTMSAIYKNEKNRIKYQQNKCGILKIEKPIYRITMPPIAVSQNSLLHKKLPKEKSRLFSLYKPQIKRDILRETINSRSLASLFNQIKDNELQNQLAKLSTNEYVQKNNTLNIISPHDNLFIKKEITLVPLKGVTFKFENPVQKAKMSRYLIDFSKITVVGRNVEN